MNKMRWPYLCHVRIVRATIISSVKIKAEKLIDTICINSSSNKINAPYIITPPEMHKKLSQCLAMQKSNQKIVTHPDKCLLAPI